ncbi:MAG: acetyltransferase [Candidatus Bruticola sp.]
MNNNLSNNFEIRGAAVYCQTPSAVKRVLILGAGQAAMQTADILLHDRTCQLVGFLDDNPDLQGQAIFGIPVLGGFSQLESLWKGGFFDASIVGIGLNVQARHACYERLQALQIPLVNAIDPTVRINRQAVLGRGIVLCSFVHLGVCAHLEDNCFIGAHCSIDHHCHLGKTVFMGPGCLLSGTVSVGDKTLFGDGVLVQLGLNIGRECRISSGAIVIHDVPDRHSLKHRLNMELKPIDK